MILLTGADGFIGSHLRKKINCITVDYQNCDYNGNLSDTNFVNSLPDVNTVIHLAAFNSTKNFYSTPFSVIESIVMPTMNLLKKYPEAHFVYASSSETYASAINNEWAPIPTPEEVPLIIEDITNPRWCYASGKIAMESAVISSSIEHNNTYNILRFHNIYGPGQKNHFIPEFIGRLRQGDNVLYGWEDTRSFCYVDDAVQLVYNTYKCKNQIINIGSNQETVILDVAYKIMDQMNIDRSKLDLEPGVTGSVSRRLPDISKLLAQVPNFEFTTLDQGIAKCIEEP